MISIRMSKNIVAMSGVALLCGATALAQSTMDNGQRGAPPSERPMPSQTVQPSDQSMPSQTSQPSDRSMSSQADHSSGQASRADKTFAKKALEGGMAEVQLGQLAAEKGGSEDVKQFGQKMVTDHTQLSDQLKPIAEQMGVTPPESLSSKDKALLTKLQGESGDQFDKTYIKAMLKDHHKDLKEFRKEAQSGQDPSLKQAASQGAEVIEQHLQQAQQLAQAHNISAPGSDSSGSPASGSGSQQ